MLRLPTLSLRRLAPSARRPMSKIARPTATVVPASRLVPHFSTTRSPESFSRTFATSGPRGNRKEADHPTAGQPPLRRTGLFDFHLAHGAKMVPFAGYSMPLSYGDVGQVASHKHVRESAGLFDVGHMVQSFVTGPSAQAFLEHLTPSSLSTLKPFHSTLSVLLNERGGIIDDTVISKHSDTRFYVVTNAARRERDLAWFEEQKDKWNAMQGEGQGRQVEVQEMEGWGLIALQGPKAAQVLQQFTAYDLSTLYFGQSAYVDINGVNVHVARGGYTGEDGFEISITPSATANIASLLAADPLVQLTGLGARDSLRLEAGMCLYGHDLDENTTPIEGALTWVIGKERREPSAGFIGAETVSKTLKDGPKQRRVGLVVDGAPAREGAEVFTADGKEKIGRVTSGIPSPTLGQNIAMGYVQSGHHKRGTEVAVMVRNKLRKATIAKMPFVDTKYHKPS